MVKKKQSYTVFARFYDDIMSNVPYDDWLEYLELIFREIGYRPEKILDLACGTGNMTLLLAKQGYQMIGIDGSHQMIDVAKEKTAKAGFNIPFSQGDFRKFTVPEPQDLVICLYDSLNYLLEEKDLNQAFQQVHRALVPGGYFIFDMNTVKRLRTILDNRKIFEEEGYYCFWKDVLEPEVPYWKVYLTFFIETENDEMYREDEVHVERAYSLQVIEGLLGDAGFAIERKYDSYSLFPGSEESERVYYVVRKV